MLIGLTYDLRQDYLDAGYGEEETAEFDRVDTIDAIETVLRELGHETDRVGRVTSLVERLSRGDRWDLVFNIAEGLHGIGREAQVPALLDAYGIPYTFSDPLVCALTLHKGMTKHVIRDLGLPTPAFIVMESEEQVARFSESEWTQSHSHSHSMIPSTGLPLQFPLFAKPIAEGTSKGVTGASKVNTPQQFAQVCTRLLRQFKQPVLVEEYLPGREVTVGIVGTGAAAEVVGVMEVLLLDSAEQEGYSYNNKKDWEGRIIYRLAQGEFAAKAAQLALDAWRGLGCRDGGRIDLRADAHGQLHFIEVNPLPGINPDISDLPIMARLAGWTYRHLLERIVASAMQRVTAGCRTAVRTLSP